MVCEEIMKMRLKQAKSVVDFKFRMERVKTLLEGTSNGRPVAYWMHRDHRVQDNWAFLFAQRLALEQGVPLHATSLLTAKSPDPGATLRSYTFCIEGLKEVEQECRHLNIGYHVATNDVQELIKLLQKLNIGSLVTDMSPLREHRKMLRSLQKVVQEDKDFRLYQVDARNIIPVWTTSSGQEKGAFTIRSKVMNKLNDFCTEFPPLIKHPFDSGPESTPIDWENIYKAIPMDRSVKPVEWAVPGAKAGIQTLSDFVHSRMAAFGEWRNDPNAEAQSNLSPWFHFGQVSPQRALLYIRQHCDTKSDSVIGFIEQLTVRRELGDNFCYYGNDQYDKFEGAPDWARKTLNDHRGDTRQKTYSLADFEQARTHDKLWNAAQKQLVQVGKIHGYMRMYWAKMILQWTRSPEEALEIAVYLNDHYSLDGCDANGYNGIMWSICGVHDKSFHDQQVFGKVR